ncbi:MAG: class I SAM-dependent methyltransferase [Bacillota bacterium]|nr:class I SAM-dependent methyltransferase [Bacillota bacterium]
MLDNKGFDIWAEEYDEFVDKNSSGYPFEGYYQLLNRIYDVVDIKKNSKILDIGFGTGVLTNRLYNDGACIYGIDFSQKMTDIAGEKMPGARFIRWDFNLGLPPELDSEKFDYIISTYAIHHLDDYKKVQFIKKLKKSLAEKGKIVIGDIAFGNRQQLESCRNKNKDIWDKDEIYLVSEEITEALAKEGINSEYIQISSCAGMLEIL